MKGEELRLLLGLVVLAVGMRFFIDLVVRRTILLQYHHGMGGEGMRRLLLAIAVLLASPMAHAETMITSLSTHRLQITSSLVGSQIVLFGAIERDAQTISRAGGYDLAVVVRGPRAMVVTRQKSRVFGIWMNTDAREFVEVPSFYALLSNKPAAETGRYRAAQPPADRRRCHHGHHAAARHQSRGDAGLP